MPYASNSGVRIHYHLDGTATGPPLVLQHGFSMCLDDWYDAGYVAALGATHRLILVEARGHGGSDRPHDPAAYRIALMAADVLAVLDELGLARAHYLGYSMGGQIGLALGLQAPERCRSLVLGGSGAGERDQDDPARRAVADILRRGSDAWADLCARTLPPAVVERQRRNDAAALLAYWTLAERRGLAAALPGLAVPSLVYAGDADGDHAGAQAAAAALPDARFVSLPGLDHNAAFERSDVVLPRITAFLAQVEAYAASN